MTRATVRSIATRICAERGMLVADILGPSRRADLCRIRERVAREARQAGFTLPQIARALNRHHTTIMHAIANEEGRVGLNHRSPFQNIMAEDRG